ncbi:S13-like H2TH domain-containing protein [Fistulina hepatica ATCC 64428]|nr:S13-like H2TH domain-containing protein [Fistulina hepatica ATCC 64428]
MVHVLGISLKDAYLARYALQQIFGIGPKLAHRLCARLEIHDRMRVKHLTPLQVTSLASFLSSPSSSMPVPKYPLAKPDFVPPPVSRTNKELMEEFALNSKTAAQKRETKGLGPVKDRDVLRKIRIMNELKAEINDNVAHQRMIGSYVGKRHDMHLPVRGQNTQNNKKIARRLNRVPRYM